jgi:hypothetical protein
MMPIEYIVASLPALSFNEPAPLSWEKFLEASEGRFDESAFKDLETQLRNAIAEARGGGEKSLRPVSGLSLYWKNRMLACFQEKDILKRDELVDSVWWEAAGELADPVAPLGTGALLTYALRLKIALKRTKISKEAGMAAFDRLADGANATAATN